jgi:hypothetical protein
MLHDQFITTRMTPTMTRETRVTFASVSSNVFETIIKNQNQRAMHEVRKWNPIDLLK